MKKVFNWGIIGPGRIARKFAEAIKVCPDSRILAVASSSKDRAVDFADRYAIERRYDSYQDLAADPAVDAIYIATTNPLHYENILLCLNHGKPVICEKPMTMNVWQTEQVINLAREKGVFLMEAIWSRFLPVYRQVDKWLAEGRIGDIQMIKADFGFTNDWPDDDRRVDINNGGGALLDIGVYNIALVCRYLGCDPAEMTSLATFFRTGVDDRSTVVLRYTNGAMAVMNNAVTVTLPNDGHIIGNKGIIRLPDHWRSEQVEWISLEGDKRRETVPCGFEGSNGYQYEILDVMDRIRGGEMESPLMPLSDSLAISRIMTAVRRQWGLVYPNCEGE